MRLVPITAVALVAALPAHADVVDVVEGHILPGMAGLSASTNALAAAAQVDCSRDRLLPLYDAAFTAWTAVADMRVGPSEQAVLTIAFWPDERGNGARTLSRILAEQGPELDDPAEFARLASAAARGFPALDLMLGGDDFTYGPGDPGCTLVRTITADLATQVQDLNHGWQAFAPALTDPGSGGNITYLDAGEARAAIYTQIITGLTLTTDQRLARPLGTFERPRPTRAQGWRTGVSLDAALGSALAAADMARALAGRPLPQTDAAADQVSRAAAAITDPAFGDINDPAARLRVEVMQQRITALRQAIETELPAIWGVSVGFNAADGD